MWAAKSLTVNAFAGSGTPARPLLLPAVMDFDFIVDDDGKEPAAPSLNGWETVVFQVMDETEALLEDELEQWLVARYF